MADEPRKTAGVQLLELITKISGKPHSEADIATADAVVAAIKAEPSDHAKAVAGEHKRK